MKISFEWQGAESIAATLRDPSFLQDGIAQFGNRAAIQISNEAKVRAPVDTGKLRASITPVFTPQSSVVASVVVASSYAVFVHDGRAAGKPPPRAALEGWAKRHGIQNVAALARAIGRRGIRARPFLADALRGSTGQMKGFLDHAARIIAERWSQHQ